MTEHEITMILTVEEFLNMKSKIDELESKIVELESTVKILSQEIKLLQESFTTRRRALNQ